MAPKDRIHMDADFTELYQRNISSVYKLCYVYLKRGADAEDAVQAVFLKLLQTDMAFQSLEHEKAWLMVTAKNCCKDLLKSGWNRRRVDFELVPEIGEEQAELEDRVVLVKLLELPEKYRLILYLYYIEGYSVKEVARLLKRNESTIRSQLQRGRTMLRERLGGEDFE